MIVHIDLNFLRYVTPSLTQFFPNNVFLLRCIFYFPLLFLVMLPEHFILSLFPNALGIPSVLSSVFFLFTFSIHLVRSIGALTGLYTLKS